MKNLLNTTVVALALVTIFASASLAGTPADEYEFTAIDNDVVIEYPATVSLEECNSYASLQNKVDRALDAFQYDVEIHENECTHTSHTGNVAILSVERTLAELGFEG